MQNSGNCRISDVSLVYLAFQHSVLMLLPGAAAFLSYLVEITGSDSREPGRESAAYRLLLYVPAEYLTKAARTHMIKRAYLTDLQLVRSLSKGKNSDHASVLEDLVTLRVFLKRVIGLVGFERNSVSGSMICFLEYHQHSFQHTGY